MAGILSRHCDERKKEKNQLLFGNWILIGFHLMFQKRNYGRLHCNCQIDLIITAQNLIIKGIKVEKYSIKVLVSSNEAM